MAPSAPGYDIATAVRHTSEDQLQSWKARMWIAIATQKHFVPGCGAIKLHMIMRAATNYKSPLETKRGLRFTHFGSNAVVKLDRTLHAVYTDQSGFEWQDFFVCSVDDLNRALGWLVDNIEATDLEYTAIVNTVSGWISRDETQLGLDVERKRSELEAAQSQDLTPVLKELEEKGKLE